MVMKREVSLAGAAVTDADLGGGDDQVGIHYCSKHPTASPACVKG